MANAFGAIIYKLIFVIPILGVTLAVGLFNYSRMITSNAADPQLITRDPDLIKLRSLNPQLRILDEFARMPIYWVTAPRTKEGILFPKSEMDGARIALRECDFSLIPSQLLYPNRTETACLEINNDAHKLSAYFFRSNDRLKTVVDFYEAPLDYNRRFGTSRDRSAERREESGGPIGAHEFVFSYLLWERADTSAFIGYREEKKLKQNGD